MFHSRNFAIRFSVMIALLALSQRPLFAQANPAKVYPFKLAPLEILDRLPKLNLGTPTEISKSERALLESGWKQARASAISPAPLADTMPLVDACLYACEVFDASKREAYRVKLDKIVQEAERELSASKLEMQRGEKLMKYLHRTVLKRGYDATQSSITVVLDGGKFNCVSATAIYYLVGAKLGLNLRPISIPSPGVLPGHASLDLVKGSERIEVESTNADGFDWQKKIKEPGVIVLGFVPDRKTGREISPMGIASLIYSNQSVSYLKSHPPQPIQAARCCACALALDPANETASNNLIAAFANWGPKLAEKKDFEGAVRVLEFALQLDPKSSIVRNNLESGWIRYIQHAISTNDDRNAASVIARAHRSLPDEADFQSAARWYIQYGERQIKDNGWENGIAFATRALKAIPKAEHPEVLRWRTGAYRRWSQSFLKSRDANGSISVLAKAHAIDPSNQGIIDGIAYHIQESFRFLEETGGWTAMAEHANQLKSRFPRLATIDDAIWNHSVRAVQKKAQDGKFVEAVSYAANVGRALESDKKQADLSGIAYDFWAQALAKQKQWKAALQKYAEGLKALPNEPRLLNNSLATFDSWVAPSIKAKNWQEAIRICGIAEKILGEQTHINKKRDYCRQQQPSGQ